MVRFEGTESISELFRFQLQLALDDLEADFDAILGKPARLRIEGREGTRYVNGIVSRFEQSGEPTRLTQYSAELVPRVWLLQHRHNSRIFQEMSVKDIIEKVLKDAHIPPDEYEFKLQRIIRHANIASSTGNPTSHSSPGSWKKRGSTTGSSSRRRSTC